MRSRLTLLTGLKIPGSQMSTVAKKLCALTESQTRHDPVPCKIDSNITEENAAGQPRVLKFSTLDLVLAG